MLVRYGYLQRAKHDLARTYSPERNRSLAASSIDVKARALLRALGGNEAAAICKAEGHYHSPMPIKLRPSDENVCLAVAACRPRPPPGPLPSGSASGSAFALSTASFIRPACDLEFTPAVAVAPRSGRSRLFLAVGGLVAACG